MAHGYQSGETAKGGIGRRDAARFASPPKEYREVPFWSWNDELDPGELRRQIGLMDEAGWGGFFMHARVGLRLLYLGRRWMECIRVCVDEAKRRDMAAWLYDEDKWPSGFAGGLSVATGRLGEAGRLNGQIFDRFAPEFTVIPAPAILNPEDGTGLRYNLTARGLPFYAGRVRLACAVTLDPAGQRVSLEIRNLRAALARIRVNGRDAGILAWQPYTLEITEFIKAGENEIELELANSLRNLLGPHHLRGGDGEGVGPDSYNSKRDWTDEYILVPFGFDEVRLEIREPVSPRALRLCGGITS